MKETRCAWCLSEQGQPAGEGSHGICKGHADAMILLYRKRKRQPYGGLSTRKEVCNGK